MQFSLCAVRPAQCKWNTARVPSYPHRAQHDPDFNFNAAGDVSGSMRNGACLTPAGRGVRPRA